MSAAPVRTLFLDDFLGSSLDTVNLWLVEPPTNGGNPAGNIATYNVAGGYLNVNVAGGSCGQCGVGDGIRFRPRIGALTGDFEMVLSGEEIERLSRDARPPFSLIDLRLTGTNLEAGIYIQGNTVGNTGTSSHSIFSFYRTGNNVVYFPARVLVLGQYYAFQFRIRRVGGVMYVGHKLPSDATWTESATPGTFAASGLTAPAISLGSGDAGFTTVNSSLKARLDWFSIIQ